MTGTDATQAVCVIYGKNDYLRRRAVDAVLARELAGGDPALDLIRADGIKAEVAEVLDDVRTTSLLGGRRVVRVDDADTFISRHREILERYVAKPCTTGCLLLVCTNFDKRTRLYKAAQKSAEIIECQPVRGRALVDWILEIARTEHGKRINPPTADYLIEHAGAAQESLEQELAKLALYAGARAEITVADVDALVAHYREQIVFAVTDAIADGDAPKALREWRQVLATDRAAPGRAIGGLAWAVRRMLEARRKMDAGTPPQALAREFRTDPARLAERLSRASRRVWEQRLEDLLVADVNSKTGLGTVAAAVEKFIVKHATSEMPR